MKRRSKLKNTTVILTLIASVWLTGCSSTASPPSGADAGGKNAPATVRVGYFPNITHAQAIVGLARGTFAEGFGKNVKIEAHVFNAGPAEMEALFAGAIDIGYIGPNPAVNGYTKSNGEALRVIAGATSGGAMFVVRKDAGVSKPKDLAGKHLASPQLGNTQDVALRAYLKKNKIKLKEEGGKATVQAAENPDILTLFIKKEIDGAWVPEPWGTRLVKEGGGRIFLDERELWAGHRFVTTNVIVSKKFLEEHPDLVQDWLRGHVKTTQWIRENPVEARNVLNDRIKKLTGKSLAADVLKKVFTRMEVTWDPVKSSLSNSAAAADLGFIKRADLKGIYELKPLNAVLREEGLAEIK